MHTHIRTYIHSYSCGQPWIPIEQAASLIVHNSYLLYKCLFSFPACTRTADVSFKSTSTSI